MARALNQLIGEGGSSPIDRAIVVTALGVQKKKKKGKEDAAPRASQQRENDTDEEWMRGPEQLNREVIEQVKGNGGS